VSGYSGFMGGGPAPAPLRTVRSPAVTEQSAMREFVDLHKDQLRYHHDHGVWFIWNRHSWQADGRKRAFFWALNHCHGLPTKATQRVRFASAVEQAARVMVEVATQAADWNPDPLLLGTPDGVVDLRSGSMRDGKPEDMITRTTSVSPADACNCPLWFAFLDRMFAGNGEVIDYLQRWCGYCLCGWVRNHVFLLLHGTGANGKGTLLNTLAAIWGSYAATASIDLFLESYVERHTTELARLDGPRLLLIPETKEGKRWDEAKLKSLTGGDRITARFMRRDDFEFTPQFKPMISGNHKPQLRTVDEAMRRRLHLLGCTVTIPPADRDPDLAIKLQAEWPAILRWAIEGFSHYQKIGLKPPNTVADTTSDYLTGQDDIAQWIDERTKPLGYGGTLGSDLYADWSPWKQARGEPAGPARVFYDKLVDKGFPKKRTMHGPEFQGIQLTQLNPSHPYAP
jgi:putative DNA primase/helicase